MSERETTYAGTQHPWETPGVIDAVDFSGRVNKRLAWGDTMTGYIKRERGAPAQGHLAVQGGPTSSILTAELEDGVRKKI